MAGECGAQHCRERFDAREQPGRCVVASNDGTARGAVQALEGQGLAGKVLVSGQDADLASLKLIVEGKQTMTIYKAIQPLAYGAVDAAVKFARGEKLATTETIDNAFKKVPAILLEPVAVDRNNLLSTDRQGWLSHVGRDLRGIAAGKMPETIIDVQSPTSNVQRLYE